MQPRILVIHRALAPYRIDLFNELYRRYGADIYFEYPTTREQNFDTQQWNERIRFPYKVLRPGPTYLPNWRRELITLCRRGNYDLVFLSEVNLITLTLLGIREFISRRMRLVVICDDSLPIAHEVIASSLDGKRLLMEHTNIDSFLLCDSRTEQLYRQHFQRGERFFTVPILQEEHFLRHQYSQVSEQARRLREHFIGAFGGQGRLLLFVGRLAQEKNLPTLLSAFEKAFAGNEQVHLLIVGEGEERGRLEALCNQLSSAGRIHFCGKKEGNALYTYYAAADAFVLPSTLERFGAVANEALIFGLPIAVSQRAGIAALATPTTKGIYLFDPTNREEMAHTLQKMLYSTPPWQEQRISLMPTTFAQSLEKLWDRVEKLTRR